MLDQTDRGDLRAAPLDLVAHRLNPPATRSPSAESVAASCTAPANARPPHPAAQCRQQLPAPCPHALAARPWLPPGRARGPCARLPRFSDGGSPDGGRDEAWSSLDNSRSNRPHPPSQRLDLTIHPQQNLDHGLTTSRIDRLCLRFAPHPQILTERFCYVPRPTERLRKTGKRPHAETTPKSKNEAIWEGFRGVRAGREASAAADSLARAGTPRQSRRLGHLRHDGARPAVVHDPIRGSSPDQP